MQWVGFKNETSVAVREHLSVSWGSRAALCALPSAAVPRGCLAWSFGLTLLILQVRLLTGIGRYNEMTYIFELLHEKHYFEVLMRKKLDPVGGGA